MADINQEEISADVELLEPETSEKVLDLTALDEAGLSERVIYVNRVAKVVKGGRRFRFTALVAVGDGNGNVGLGYGKAGQVPDAIRKAVQNATKNMSKVPHSGTTIPHEVLGEFSAGKVLLRPAARGTGIVAGSCVRAIVELAGIKDLVTKCMGSKTHHNLANATIDALRQLRSIEDVAKLRGKTPEEILGASYTNAES